jgi:two-component system nitrogen regulation response regulator GlnG
VRRAVLLSTDVIEKHHLCQPSTRTTREFNVEPALLGASEPKGGGLPEIVDQVTAGLEKALIERVLRETKGNKSKAAKHLKIGYKTLHRKLKTYRIGSA